MHSRSASSTVDCAEGEGKEEGEDGVGLASGVSVCICVRALVQVRPCSLLRKISTMDGDEEVYILRALSDWTHVCRGNHR